HALAENSSLVGSAIAKNKQYGPPSYKIRQRGISVLRSISHKRRPPRNAFRLSPLFTPSGKFFIFLTLPPPRTTVSATNESFSCVTQESTSSLRAFPPRRSSPFMPSQSSILR